MSDYKPTEKEIETIKEVIATNYKTLTDVLPDIISKFAEMFPDIVRSTANFLENFSIKLNNGEFDDLIVEKLTELVLNAKDKAIDEVKE